MTPDPEETRRMREGVRAALAKAWHRTGTGLLRMTPAGIIGVLCVGAFGPVLAAPGVLGLTGAAAVAGIGVLGSVGANVLTNVITSAVDRVRERGGPATQDDIERELMAQLEKALAGVRADELRADIAEVLRKIDVATAALETAMAHGESPERLAGLLGVLGAEFDEFGFMLTDVQDAAGQIQETLRRQDAEHLADRERVREQSTQIRLLREELAVLVRLSAHREEVQQAPEWVGRCPYRGLWPFDQDHTAIFYGREQRTAELVGTLGERLAGHGVLIVTGASGAGKSSLLRAGLLPALARGSLAPGTQDWPRVVMTPTRTPVDELAIHLAALSGMDAAATSRSIAASPGQAHLLVREALLRTDRHARLVLVVDQFEELFTEGAGQRDEFLTAVRAMSEAACALVVLAVRGDFIDRCAELPELATAFAEGAFVVGPMSEADLRRTITGPAAAAGIEVEPGLVETVLGDLRSVGSDVGALPLLSQAMLLTWEQANGRLAIRDYGQAGGVAKAVEASAELAYESLDPAEQAAARRMLLALVAAGGDGRFTRRARARAELDAQENVLKAFADKRLLILNGDTVEISHDALLHAWPRLRGWLEGDQAERVLRSHLVDDATTWHDHGRDPSFLYRGTQLAAVSAATGLPPAAQEFLAVSRRADRRDTRLRRAAVVTLVVLLVAAVAGGGAAIYNAIQVNHQHAQALSRQLAAQSQTVVESDPTTAKRLAAAAWRVAQTPEARYAMFTALSEPQRAVLRGHTDRITALASSRDGRLIVTGSFDKSLRVWDAVTGRQLGDLIPNDGKEVLGVALSPDGKTIAVTTDDVVRFWDVATRGLVGEPLSGHTGPVWGLAFSPDGTTLATTSADHTVRLWDLASRKQAGDPFAGHTDVVTSVVFGANGTTLATGGWDRTARLWDVATRRQLGKPFTGHTDQIWHVALSPDGRTLATASIDKTARLWDVTTHEQLGEPFTGHNAPVFGVAFSTDGTVVATTGEDKTARLWTAGSRRQLGAPLTGHSDKVFGAVFGPDGATLVTVGFDSTVRLWDVTARRPSGVLRHDSALLDVAFSPDGTKLAAAGNGIRLWDVAARKELGPSLAGHNGKVGRIAFRGDGAVLASVSADKTARLWNVETYQQLGGPLSGHDDLVLGVAYSPDGSTLATASHDKTARLWDLKTHQPLGDPLAGHSATVFGIAFSPDGATLATGAWDTKVCLWDVARRQQSACLDQGTNNDVNTVSFSPDGRTLAAAGFGDRAVRLWDVASRKQIGAPLPGHTEAVYSSAFTPSGTILATASADQTVRLWDVGTRRQIGPALQEHTGEVRAVAFSRDGRSMATASADQTVLLWDISAFADPHAAIVARVGEITEQEWDRYAPGEPMPE